MINPELEYRFTEEIELRGASTPESNSPGTLVGYACKWNDTSKTLTNKLGKRFKERIMPGAFSTSLRSEDVLACVDHEEGKIMGRTVAGTLKLFDDGVGMRYENELPDTTDGRNLAVQVGRGDIRGMSFAFLATPKGEQWDVRQNPPLRTVSEANLYHVSYESRPAYGGTTVAFRSLEAALASEIDVPAVEERAAEPPADVPEVPSSEPIQSTEQNAGNTGDPQAFLILARARLRVAQAF